MENLKIKVNGKKDGDLAQNLFFNLGYGFDGCKIKTIQHLEYTSDYYFFAYAHDMDLTHSCDYGVFMNKAHKEITLQELRNMVEPKMKEYLFKYNDQYTLVELSKEDAESNPEQYIKVPNGMNFAWKDSDSVWFTALLMGYRDAEIIWQRETLNDKIATAEVARQQSKNIDATLAERQSQYGSFEDVAFVTENIMATLAKVRSNGLQDLPHTHRMALYMIASKVARIVNGDFNHLDSWHDIGGYSKLIEDLIGDVNEI